MQASTHKAPDATGATIIPPVERAAALRQCGLSASARWEGVSRRPRYVDDADAVDADTYRLAGGWDDPEIADRELEALGFIIEGGWTPVSKKNNANGDGGLTSHRGVLHPDEYVDTARLQVLVEGALGYTYADLHCVYSTGGRPSAGLLDIRARIDARLLEVAAAGANMDAFGRVVGINARTLDRALARARSVREVAA